MEGGLLGWHVLGALRPAGIQEHICVFFSRHPCGETKDSKQKPDGAHRGVTGRRDKSLPATSRYERTHPKPAHTRSRKQQEPQRHEEDPSADILPLPVMHNPDNTPVLVNERAGVRV